MKHEGIEDVELMDTAAIVRDKPNADENTLYECVRAEEACRYLSEAILRPH